MLPTALLSRDCTITSRVAGGTTDDYGNAIPTETQTTTRCELQQNRRDEQDAQGEVSDTVWLLVLPAGTTITTADVVTVDGDTYEVVGAPWEARDPATGRESHVEATLRRTA